MCHCSCTAMSLHPPSFNIVRCSFCLTMLCYLMIFCLLLFIIFTDLSLYLWQVAACVDVNVSTWLMLLCPNNNKVSFSAYPYWLHCGDIFLIMSFLPCSHTCFVPLQFCLIVSLCSTSTCLDCCITVGMLMWVFFIISFLSASISLECLCLCSLASWSMNSLNLYSACGQMAFDISFQR